MLRKSANLYRKGSKFQINKGCIRGRNYAVDDGFSLLLLSISTNKMRQIKIILSILLILSTITAFPQKDKFVKVKNVRGEFAATKDSEVSIKQAYENALLNAMKNALGQVCGHKVSIQEMIESGTVGEFYSSVATNRTEGEIVNREIVESGAGINPARNSELVFYYVINAEVKKNGIEPDPDFVHEVAGIKNIYNSNENIEFDITPQRNTYLKVFLMEDADKGYMIYPKGDEMPELLPAKITQHLPKSTNLVVNKGADAPVEKNLLVFVFTKEERPFYHETISRQEIEQYIAKIPNDKKFVYYRLFEIRE